MTDKQKIQSLIDAAMRSAAEPGSDLTRAVPSASPAAGRRAELEPETAAPQPAEESAAQVSIPDSKPEAPVVALDKEAADRLGKLLDERIVRDKRRRRRAALVTALLVLGSLGAGTGWFVSDGQRVEALRIAMREIRSVTDVKALVASYQKSLDQIAQRRNHIDMASREMGVDPTQNQGDDIHMEAEMRQMIGDDGSRTVDQRNKLLSQKFGEAAAQAVE